MSAIRQDAWSPDDDLILAEVTLRHIRDGGTQLKAFEEVGERIGRTAAACGFRWNSCVRKKYEEAIQIAKSQRQKRNKKPLYVPSGAIDDGDGLVGKAESNPDTITIDRMIRYLRQWKGTWQEMNKQIRHLERQLKDTQESLHQVQAENDKLRGEVNHKQSDYKAINEDYKALIQIMDRARKLAFLSGDEEDLKPRFKMDANGNLERIE